MRIFCTRCGEQKEDKHYFCIYCGHRDPQVNCDCIQKNTPPKMVRENKEFMEILKKI